MANDKDFIVKNAVEIGGSVKTTLGTMTKGITTQISDFAYDSKSFDTTSESGVPQSVAFKDDGTKMYVVASGGDAVYQYSLSTAWDVSTASYDSVSLDVSTEDTAPLDVFFKSDGTELYIMGITNDTVFQYSLTTGWDLSTASYANKSFDASSQDTLPSAFHFKDDGTKMYILGRTSDAIYQYTLSTAWDVSTATYDSVSLSVSSQELNGILLSFDDAGTKLYVAGTSNDKFFEYALTAPWDLSTATYTGNSFSFNAQTSLPTGGVIGKSGEKIYLVANLIGVLQYTAGSPSVTLDLSTGNYFNDTLAGNTTYTISNAGDVQSFQLEVTGGAIGPVDSFSTTLYSGTADAATIETGVDLLNDGGLLWIKSRSDAYSHYLFDTERTLGNRLSSDSNAAEADDTKTISAFTSSGFSFPTTTAQVNDNGSTFVAWSFKKQSSFFDVVEYTGDGTTTKTVSHNLGVEPGLIIFKRTDSTGNWTVWHRSTPLGSYTQPYLRLNGDFATTGLGDYGNSLVPTSTVIRTPVHQNAGNTADSVNVSGASYIAYLFAHDTSADSMIKCGSYTGNGNATGPIIDLGWQPQWVLIKETDNTGNWQLFDSERGIVEGGVDARIAPNTTDAEDSIQSLNLTSTGFQINTTSGNMNTNNSDHIYIAIRKLSDASITWPSSIEWTEGTAPTAPANGQKDIFSFTTADSGTSYIGTHAADNLS